jgi:hypothetical protein
MEDPLKEPLKDPLKDALKNKRRIIPKFSNPFISTPAQKAAASKKRTEILVNESLVELEQIQKSSQKAMDENESLHQEFDAAEYKPEKDYYGEVGSYTPVVNKDRKESDKKPSMLMQ